MRRFIQVWTSIEENSIIPVIIRLIRAFINYMERFVLGLRILIAFILIIPLLLSACILPGMPTSEVQPAITMTPVLTKLVPTITYTPTTDPSAPLILRGKEYHEKNDYLSALDAFDKAIAQNPNSYEAHFERGRVLTDVKDYESALVDFEMALALDPTRAEAFNGRGVVRTKLGDYEMALQDFGLAVIIKPDYSEAYSNRGIAYVHLREVDTGIANFTHALELDPNNVDAFYNRALAYLILGDNRAIDDFRKVLELSDDPDMRRVAADNLQETE